MAIIIIFKKSKWKQRFIETHLREDRNPKITDSFVKGINQIILKSNKEKQFNWKYFKAWIIYQC